MPGVREFKDVPRLPALVLPEFQKVQDEAVRHCLRILMEGQFPTVRRALDAIRIAGTSIEDHRNLNHLTTGDAGHTQFLLLAGRSGGQIAHGGTDSGDDLVLRSTAHATKGSVVVNQALDFTVSATNTIDLTGPTTVVSAATSFTVTSALSSVAGLFRLTGPDMATGGLLRILEPANNGSNYIQFTAPSLAADTAYTLPNAFPVSSGQALVSTTGGVMSWATMLSDHNHTDASDGGVLTADEHDSYSEYQNVASEQAGAANVARIYCKDFDGTNGDARLHVVGELGGGPVAVGNGAVALPKNPQITTAQVGRSMTVIASDATAGSSVAGAAEGGTLNLTSGAAARNTSGNANGGNIALTTGAGIGTGTSGNVTVTCNDATITASDDISLLASDSVTINGTSIVTIDGQNGIFLIPSSGNVEIVLGTAGAFEINNVNFFAFFRGYIDGLIMSNSAGDATNDIEISAGVATDTTGVMMFRNTSAHTKRIDATWASGTGNGGMANGLTVTNDTWYHVFAVDNGNGDTEFGFDTSITATNLLATSGVGTLYRRIGSVRRNTAANGVFTQYGDEFLWTTVPALDIDVTEDATANTRALTNVPPDVKVWARLNVLTLHASAGRQVYVSSLDQADQATSTTAAPLYTTNTTDASGRQNSSPLLVRTDTSAQIRTVASGTSTTLRIAVLGWIDQRGKNA